jgi:peptidoglycan/LPS O-acetylase OafA/YrhL
MFKKLRIFAWLGLGLVVIGLPISFYSSVLLANDGLYSNSGYRIAYTLAMVGVILMALGGIIARPRLLWLVSIITGIAYIASLYGWLGNNDADFTGITMVLIPGLVCIILGLLMRRLPGKRGKA